MAWLGDGGSQLGCCGFLWSVRRRSVVLVLAFWVYLGLACLSWFGGLALSLVGLFLFLVCTCFGWIALALLGLFWLVGVVPGCWLLWLCLGLLGLSKLCSQLLYFWCPLAFPKFF